jgi:hypothetical protein
MREESVADTYRRATNASSKPTAHHQNQHREHRANSPPAPLGKRGQPTAITSSPKCSVRWNGYRPREGSCRDQDQEPVPGQLRMEGQQLERDRRRLRGVLRVDLPRQRGDEGVRTGAFSSCIASPLYDRRGYFSSLLRSKIAYREQQYQSLGGHGQRATPFPHVAFYDAPRAERRCDIHSN